MALSSLSPKQDLMYLCCALKTQAASLRWYEAYMLDAVLVLVVPIGVLLGLAGCLLQRCCSRGGSRKSKTE